MSRLLLHFDGMRLEGVRPLATVDFRGDSWQWKRHKSTFPGTDGQGTVSDFFEELRRVLSWGKRHFPQGGAVGMASYELGYALEPRALQNRFAKAPAALPLLRYTFYEQLERAPLASSASHPPCVPAPPAMERDYNAAINAILDYIHRGDIYQANYVRQFSQPLTVRPQVLFERLWQAHPMPFAAFLEWDDFAIVSNSPERFLRVQDRVVRAEPIKGTCPRGDDAAEDERLKVLLGNSSKDRAENVMITDLMRNDLGRVCRFGSVRVASLCEVRTFPTLHHLVSVIEGELRSELDALDAFAAAFPCGSITGAPKIRAMQIIDELEPVARGVAMGAIGYIDFDGNADWNVAIRTILCQNDSAIFHVGGGIVSDSNPQDEWNEMQLKAAAILQLL